MKKYQQKPNNKELQKRNSVQAAIVSTIATPAVWAIMLNHPDHPWMLVIASCLCLILTMIFWALVALNK